MVKILPGIGLRVGVQPGGDVVAGRMNERAKVHLAARRL
jgi:hypothetical protein